MLEITIGALEPDLSWPIVFTSIRQSGYYRLPVYAFPNRVQK